MATCLVAEVVCASSLAVAGVLGGSAAFDRLADVFGETRARAEPIDLAELEAGALGPVAPAAIFEGIADDVLLQPIRHGAIESVKFNRGGSSISLRVDFKNGARAAFKPRQIHLHSVPRYEVAAYRLDRLLGLSSVAPATGRRFAVDELLAALEPESRVYARRIRDEITPENGSLLGVASYWIPVIRPARIGGYFADSVDGVLTWTRFLTPGVEIPRRWRRAAGQISTLVAFDFLIDNGDRFSGRNVWHSDDRQTLYFMDNTSSFSGGPEGSFKARTYLRKVRRFSRSLHLALRSLGREAITEAMTRDAAPFAALLEPDEIENLVGRRDYLLHYIAKLIDRHGASEVLVFP